MPREYIVVRSDLCAGFIPDTGCMETKAKTAEGNFQIANFSLTGHAGEYNRGILVPTADLIAGIQTPGKGTYKIATAKIEQSRPRLKILRGHGWSHDLDLPGVIDNLIEGTAHLIQTIPDYSSVHQIVSHPTLPIYISMLHVLREAKKTISSL